MLSHRFTGLQGNTNKGCYGADLIYRIPVKCEHSNGQVFVSLRARNNAFYPGGPGWKKYAGAGQVIQTNITSVAAPYDIPKYPCDKAGETNKFRNAFDLLESIGVAYLPGSRFDAFDIKIAVANACAASLPTNIMLSRTDVASEPVEESG